MEKIKVCAYARVSTDSKDQENSFENQKTYFEREIEKNPLYSLTRIYKDKGLTATSTAQRKEFLEMVHDAGIDIDMYKYTHQNKDKHEQVFLLSDREPLFNRIFVKNTSRFARNIDVIDLLRKLRQKEVYVEFLDINKSTENEADFVFIEMLLVFDENESRDKSRKVKFGQKEGMRKGVIHTNSRLYGYNYIQEENRLEIIPEESEVIKFIFNEYAEGNGIRVIQNKLKEKGYKTRQGKDFAKSTISNILKNPKYKGDNVRNRYTTGTIFVDKTNTVREKDKEDWIIHEDTIPAIISDEIFNKCEEIRQTRNKNQRGIYHGTTKYARLIKCGKCGASYIRNVDRGRYFYNCSTKKTQGVDVCDNINVAQKILDDKLQELADGEFERYIYIQSKLHIVSLESIVDMLDVKLNEGIDKTKLQKYNTQLADIQKQKDRLSDLYLTDRVSLEYFDNKNVKLEEQYNEVKGKVKYLMGGKELILKEISKAEELIKIMSNNENNINNKYTSDDILEEIEIITVYEDKGEIKLDIEFKIFNDMLKLMRKYVTEINN